MLWLVLSLFGLLGVLFVGGCLYAVARFAETDVAEYR
jgi:hypothetical protein